MSYAENALAARFVELSEDVGAQQLGRMRFVRLQVYSAIEWLKANGSRWNDVAVMQ